ncbi:hypothetical protein [Nonomuraea deserti]|uniref:hypothetical protein n=1 Tax=Nonomuraea deserti TaxID=1848322 RepID=UPI001FE6FB8F|nr:hypothetical protein [Nonomuraea deserti]
MHLLTRARRSQAHGGLAAHLREPARVVFLALLGLVAAGWVLVALDGGQFLTLESVVGIQQAPPPSASWRSVRRWRSWPGRSTCPWRT